MSYTPTADDINSVRTLIRDTCSPPVLTDLEVMLLLQINGYSIVGGAAAAAEAIARDRAKLKLMVNAGTFHTEREGSEVMLALADSIRTAPRKQASAVTERICAGRLDPDTGGLGGYGPRRDWDNR